HFNKVLTIQMLLPK
ncbi:hypothetical protein D047_2858B, partial [Vibrio parahaemolyticus VPTS-2010_2]